VVLRCTCFRPVLIAPGRAARKLVFIMDNEPVIPLRPRSAGGPQRRILIAIAGLAFLIFVLVPWLTSVAADWMWFQEIGYEVVFIRQIVVRALLFLGVGLFTYLFIRVNLGFAQRGPVLQPVVLVSEQGGAPLDLVHLANRVLRPITIVFAFLFAIAGSGLWLTVLRGINATPVGVADPQFGRDIGYYFFTWPMITAALGILSGVLMITLLMLAVLYWVRGELVLPPRRASIERGPAIHIGSLLAAYFLLLAVRLIVADLPQLLWSTTGPLIGASYTDVGARLPGYWISAVAAVAGAGLVVYGIMRGKLIWYTAVAVLAYVAVGLLARGAYPFAVQRLVVAPNELSAEADFLQRHIRATRHAWGVDRVETRDLTGEATLTLANIRANTPTIENVRLWERHLLRQTFAQLQEIRTYYDFVNVDDDRYVIDGSYRQVHLSAREMNSASLPARTFINERLTFTHGMGLTLAPVNQVTEEGLPVLFIKDLPPESSVDMHVTRPEIYFGELSENWVVVRTHQREFNYPSGEENIFTRYDGQGGVPVRGVLRRALFASYLGSLKLFLSNDITSESRVMYFRNVPQRVRKALPFLTFDGDPYLVVGDDGRMHWIVDAYTASDRYPYSAAVRDGTNYMRNSVKVVVDAYHGTVDAFVVDTSDAVIRTYARAFPGIFRTYAEMPLDLRRQIRYPTDLFRIQNAIYSTYHMMETHTFYNREDQWEIPTLGTPGREQESSFMRRMIMKLPGEGDAEFIYMTPFTPRGKHNLSSWLVARSDEPNYGRLIAYRFPKQSLVYGPRQIVNRINQDTEIARQITLWDQRGSQVIRGELLVIPIDESLLYVQPLYLRAEGGTIPELKRVIVAHQNRVVMEETLDQALEVLFGGAPRSPIEEVPAPAPGAPVPAPVMAPPTPTPTPAPAALAPPTGDAAALMRQAREHYDRALAAQRAGDWARYGQEIQQLGAVLRRLEGR
jgi:uncharacterized protein